ncbi:hypothetical protein BGZ46_003194 [Entomortierella lignicola]|nr:hypothetical protein BGZ46_003194 [Entomortierella lignicola]
MNSTRWNSEYSMAARVLDIFEAIRATLEMLKTGEADEKARAVELKKIMLVEQEVQALREIISLLEPVAQFTHWTGKSDHPTTSQIYPKIHSMIPASNSFATQQAQDLCGNPHCIIKELWPLETIPDPVLLSIFLNPACASVPMLDLPVTGDDGLTLRDKAKALAVKAHISLREKEITSKDSSQSGQLESQGSRSELQSIQAGKQQDRPELKETSENKLSMGYLGLEASFAVEAYCLNVKENSDALKYYMDIPQDYWRDRGSKPHYVKLAEIARSYVCIQATSNDSERLFSKAGQVISARKTSITDHNFRNIIFYNSFSRINEILNCQ